MAAYEVAARNIRRIRVHGVYEYIGYGVYEYIGYGVYEYIVYTVYGVYEYIYMPAWLRLGPLTGTR